jgi:hypothetical protein
MQTTVVTSLILHVLSGVFWAGSTFALARIGGNQAGHLLRPQLGAAAVTMGTGTLLWYLLHQSGAGLSEHILATGAFFALIAAGVQAGTAFAVRQVFAGARHLQNARSENRAATGQRIAAGCLAVTVICMAAFRYV